MQNKTKNMIAAIVVLAVLLTCFLVSYLVFRLPLFDASGWRTTDAGQVQYLNYFGWPSKGFVTVDDRQYYFDEKGAMQTGWVSVGEDIYYMGKDGVMQTGWLDTQEGRYYLWDDGAAITGWLDLPEGIYYFTSDHRMYTGWLKSGESHFYFGDDGRRKTGWLDTDDGRYYLNADGVRQVSWQEIDGGRYFFHADGKMHTGWLSTRDGKFYLTESGKANVGWLTLPEGRYYMDEKGAMVTGFVTIDGYERYFQENGEYVPLINPWNPVTEDYQLQLTEVEGYQVDITCAEALKEMMAACRDAGHSVKINSAYRDLEKQQSVWEEYRRNYMAQGYSYAKAEKLTAGYVAVPGTSEHHTGLGVDLGSGKKIYAWLAKHCWEYGFILRYPEDKTGTTGFNYEPWHFRYLGKTLAKAVFESGLTLEGYLQSIK